MRSVQHQNPQPETDTPNPATLAGTRVRLQRLSDAKFFSGWVIELTAETVLIKINGEPELKVGDRFAAEIHGATHVARGTIELTDPNASATRFQITAAMQYATVTEQARFLVDGVTCLIFVDGREIAAEVIDYSAKGLGFRSLRPLYPGTDVEMVVTSGTLSASVDGQIRHCRLDPDAPGRYRGGVLIEPRDSEQAYAWDTFRARLQSTVRPAA
jgi:hypothetical protein